MPLRAILRSPIASALAAPHGVDAYLRALSPRWMVHDVRATIERVVRETPTATTLTLKPNLAWDGHRAGLHVEVGVDLGGVRHRRCFSISSSEHRRDGRITLTIRAVGRVSSHLAFEAKPGDELAISQARGEFVLPSERPSRILLLSGGSGITPVMSMMRTLLDEGHRGELVFLHYARSEEERIYAAELDGLRDRVRIVNVIGAHFRPDHVAPYLGFETFLCGPPAMMAAVRAAIPPSTALREERFVGFVASSNDAGEVRFARSGVRRHCDGRPLLVVAEEAGLRPESGCRRGICRGCTRRKLSGTVRDLRTGELSSEPDQDIQICVTAAASDVTLDL
ncbi:Flavodoxin reductases (ferredoxin-NADPH reductases) family 1 [Minicystis rosea]|nr:Flavodoxin reductases (ferredoxin-NADPH reductases) family 1 [Minicystis rosea]